MSKLTGKVALVTGASKGIGAAIAEHLAAAGASVVVNFASSKQGAEATVERITQAGGRAVAIGADVSQPDQIETLIQETINAFGGTIDILVNNAGVYEMAPLEAITADSFHRQFNLNVLGLLLTTQAAVRHFPPSGGSVINISSVVGKNGAANMAVYSATKGAVDQITIALSKELGPKHIRVNSISPGPVATEGTADFTAFFEQMTPQIPIGRIGQPKDIGSVAVFFASDDSSWLSGEAVSIAGGFRG